MSSFINTCVPYMPSNTTVILVGVLFYHGYMFRRLIGPSSGYSGGLRCYYQSIYMFTVTSPLGQVLTMTYETLRTKTNNVPDLTGTYT
jgi:hypothetical protein